MILGFLFFIQNVLKHCKALSTEKYRRYILNIYYYYYVKFSTGIFPGKKYPVKSHPETLDFQHLSEGLNGVNR